MKSLSYFLYMKLSYALFYAKNIFMTPQRMDKTIRLIMLMAMIAFNIGMAFFFMHYKTGSFSQNLIMLPVFLVGSNVGFMGTIAILYGIEFYMCEEHRTPQFKKNWAFEQKRLDKNFLLLGKFWKIRFKNHLEPTTQKKNLL